MGSRDTGFASLRDTGFAGTQKLECAVEQRFGISERDSVVDVWML